LLLGASPGLRAQVSAAAWPAELSPTATPDYQVVERGPHHRVWQRVVSATDELGRVSYVTNSYVELASGMHYLEPKSGQWLESQEIIESFPGGAIARHGQHQVIFANDLATAGAIDMQTPDGKRLSSHVLGLSYFDASTGTNVLIAEVTNCLGKIVAPNQVIYEHAFDALDASVRYTYTRGGFEQDIILLESPAPPEDYGLNPATTRLVVMTEFLNPPQPAVRQSAVTSGASGPSEDDALDFGAIQLHSGRGFLLGPNAAGPGQKVFAQWAALEGRQFLLEQVRAAELFQAIRSLPGNQGASLRSPDQAVRFTASSRQLPPREPGKPDTQTMLFASHPLPQQGYLIDYVTVVATNRLTLQADTTYYVSGPVNISDTLTCEGCTCVKFAPGTNASLSAATTVTLGSMYRPSIFTASDDDTVGQKISGSSGNPWANYYGSAMLNLGGNSTALNCLRLSHAATAIEFSGGGQNYSLNHAQLVHCRRALNGTGGAGAAFTLNNVLLCRVSNIWDSVNAVTLGGAQVTLDQVTNRPGLSSTFTNSLFAATSGFSGGVSNAWFTSGSGVFQTVGAAGYYLADSSTNRNAGTTNLAPGLLADLKKRTTYPPFLLTSSPTNDTTLSAQAARETGIPDLGYAYDPLDWAVKGVTVTHTLLLTNGVAVGTFGDAGGYALALSGYGKLISQGAPGRLNAIVRYNVVQEQSNTNWVTAPSWLLGEPIWYTVQTLSSNATAQCSFTLWSIAGPPALLGPSHFYQSSISASSWFSHCQFTGGTMLASYGSLAFTNCLLERVATYLADGPNPSPWYLYNNLFFGGTLTLTLNTNPPGPLYAFDNLFDRTAIVNNSGVSTNGYNAYVTNCTTLANSQGNDVILTNSPVYQTSYLGTYYYPTNGGLLSTLINAGSRSATNAALYHFTTTTNQVKEAATTVDIGFHYVAIDPSTGQPYDADGDGIPDYLEDANGDGAYGAGDLSDWRAYNSRNGLSGASGLEVFTPLR
jgi:hypothetical protein